MTRRAALRSPITKRRETASCAIPIGAMTDGSKSGAGAGLASGGAAIGVAAGTVDTVDVGGAGAGGGGLSRFALAILRPVELPPSDEMVGGPIERSRASSCGH